MSFGRGVAEPRRVAAISVRGPAKRDGVPWAVPYGAFIRAKIQIRCAADALVGPAPDFIRGADREINRARYGTFIVKTGKTCIENQPSNSMRGAMKPSFRMITLVGLIAAGVLLGLGCSDDDDNPVYPKAQSGTASFFLIVDSDSVFNGEFRYSVNLYFDAGDSCRFSFSRFVNPIDSTIHGPWRINLLDGDMPAHTYSCVVTLPVGQFSAMGSVTASYQGVFPDSVIGTFGIEDIQITGGVNTSKGIISVW